VSFDQRASRALLQSLRHELVTVEALAAQRHEQGARLERARVRDHGPERGIGAVQHAARHLREISKAADHASSPSASSTTARSLKGRDSVPTTW
jgi:hypothetical protein